MRELGIHPLLRCILHSPNIWAHLLKYCLNIQQHPLVCRGVLCYLRSITYMYVNNNGRSLESCWVTVSRPTKQGTPTDEARNYEERLKVSCCFTSMPYSPLLALSCSAFRRGANSKVYRKEIYRVLFQTSLIQASQQQGKLKCMVLI
jgi:hypothetical protein